MRNKRVSYNVILFYCKISMTFAMKAKKNEAKVENRKIDFLDLKIIKNH